MEEIHASMRGARGRREELITHIEELILSGHFGPGDRLPPERELAESLGASRPLVHAALEELAARGLVRIESRHGVVVADWRREGSFEMLLSLMSYGGGDLSPRLFDSLLEMRVFFETETARLAAARRGPEQLAALERVVARERLLESPAGHAVTELDFEFHHAVALASGNDIYPLLMNSFRRVYERILDRFYSDPVVVPEVFRLHGELLAAVAAGEEHRAAATMREILEFGERNLRRILVRGPAGSGDGAVGAGGREGSEA
ncbi:MAG: FadR family transcriptional regulator [Spirochaetaceae bacterium]|nr:FadR family transcriptional regulator [Spirochaetaceae bacterium]